MKRFTVALALSALLAMNVFGDIARPDISKQPPAKKTKQVDGSLQIRLDHTATEARLVIPKNRLKQLRAELEELDGDSSDTNAAAAATTNFTKTQTVAGGLFLSLGFVLGGVWLARVGRGRLPQGETKINKKIAGGAAVLFLLGGAAVTTYVYANAGPPVQLRSINGRLFDKKTFSGWGSAYGQIKIEISDSNATRLELIVPDPRDGGVASDAAPPEEE